MPSVLELQNITKRFPGVLANKDVSFDLQEGEILALLGENGAGKTTLMNILYGLLRPDEGDIRVRGRTVSIASPQDALLSGIGMVHQHFMLVPPMTVAENIVLGYEPTQGPFLKIKDAIARIDSLSHDYGLDVNPRRRIWQLSVGEQQRVEILKVMYQGADILILDEPTAVLTPPEAEALFDILRSMKSRGKSVIFISHKLEEVLGISDRVTVLRRGEVVGTVQTSETTDAELARMMVGRDVVLRVARETGAECRGETVVELKQVSTTGFQGKQALSDINLELCSGEIVGVAGVDGNGQSELAEVIVGLRDITAGKVIIDGRTDVPADPFARLECGVLYVPADRKARGAVMELSIADNAVLKNHRHSPYSRHGVLDHRAIRSFGQELMDKYDIRCPSVDTLVGTLSGGNMQKLILARETVSNPRLLVAEHPTRGLDIGATEYVRQLLLRQRQEGTSILLISADLDEVVALSDRIIVLYEGRIVYECEGDGADLHKLGLAMAGYQIAEGDKSQE